MEYRLSIPVYIDNDGAGNGVQIPDTKETRYLAKAIGGTFQRILG